VGPDIIWAFAGLGASYDNPTFKELRCNFQIAADSTGMSLHLRSIFRDRAHTMHAVPRRDKASRSDLCQVCPH
jgi:hypothetical protein